MAEGGNQAALLERVSGWLDANASPLGFRVVSRRRMGARNELKFESADGKRFLECWFCHETKAGVAWRTQTPLAFGYRGISGDAASQQLLGRVWGWLCHLLTLGVLAELLRDEISGDDEAVYLLGGHTLELRLTHLCNECCVYCSVNEANVPNTAKDLPDALARAKRALDAGVSRLVVTGGEPTLVDWLVPFVQQVAGMGFLDIEVQTNGTRLALGGLAHKLSEIPGVSLFVSLPGMDAETVGRSTGKALLFEDKVAGIHAALHAGLPVTLNHVVYAGNVAALTMVAPEVRRAFGQEIRRLVFSVVSPSGRADGAGLAVVPRYRDISGVLLAALQQATELGFECTIPENCGIPMCVNPALRVYAEPYSEAHPPRSPDKVKFAHCATCVWEGRCSGVFSRYLDLHGHDEFRAAILE